MNGVVFSKEFLDRQLSFAEKVSALSGMPLSRQHEIVRTPRRDYPTGSETLPSKGSGSTSRTAASRRGIAVRTSTRASVAQLPTVGCDFLRSQRRALVSPYGPAPRREGAAAAIRFVASFRDVTNDES
jgi:hypothetical protein